LSTKHPEGETGLEKGWWLNPTFIGPIIVAVIGGVALISAAFTQRPAPRPKSPDPTKIEQQTHGSGSPAIGQTGGNVTIHQ
jgi:hypothetical protein